MKAVIQRVSQASVCIKGQIYSQIKQGLLIFLGIEHSDTEQDIEWLSKKIANLRIFADENNQMNKSVIDTKGQILLVSQFTLHAKTKRVIDLHLLRRHVQKMLSLFMNPL